MTTKTYEPIGTEVETLRIKHFYATIKTGDRAEELLDKIEALVKQSCHDGEWSFQWDIE